MAYREWRDNSDLIADVARLGYLDGSVFDVTYGYGTFWKEWQPESLLRTDLDPVKSLDRPEGVDFTRLPVEDESFDAVVFDPPYKLNGRPDDSIDERYGVHEMTRWQDRMALMRAGLVECCRVARTHVLVKCQDQVCSGRVRWQTDEMTEVAKACGFGKVDRFDFPTYRPQPEKNRDGSRRRQVHARRNTSSLLVFRRGWWTSDLAAKKPTLDLTEDELRPAPCITFPLLHHAGYDGSVTDGDLGAMFRLWLRQGELRADSPSSPASLRGGVQSGTDTP